MSATEYLAIGLNLAKDIGLFNPFTAFITICLAFAFFRMLVGR